jgi:hypothetical protein
MRRSIQHWFIVAGLAIASGAYDLYAQKAAAPPPTLILTAATVTADVATLADPLAVAWQSIPAKKIALNRTPRLYETEPPSGVEISEIELRTARAGGRVMVHLAWQDPTEDTATITAAPGVPTEGRFLKAPTEVTDRFFDAAAVMCPTKAGTAVPGLQMGDAQDPVTIYYWNAARGPMLMEAQGRETTRRTGQGFPARAMYRSGTWSVSLGLPDLPRGTPLAFAIWNGSQQDRDGRKYFTVWHWLE